jgi:hypothetical protein
MKNANDFSLSCVQDGTLALNNPYFRASALNDDHISPPMVMGQDNDNTLHSHQVNSYYLNKITINSALCVG